MNNYTAIAIDGPAGAGKSTVAKALAAELGYIYVDTGALYRAIGYAVTASGADPSDAEGVIKLLDTLQIDLTYENGTQGVLVNGTDVSAFIRTPAVSMAASKVSALPPVRAFLLELQRDMARRHNVIMDGRDIGTVVLPDAQVKIFLTASAENRAQRRYKELQEKGVDTTFDDVLREMRQRDEQDTHRAIAPLVAAPDALLVDTSAMTLTASIAYMKELITAHL